VPIAREPWDARTFWGRQAYIKDPSGYILSLREWRAPDGRASRNGHSHMMELSGWLNGRRQCNRSEAGAKRQGVLP